MEKSHIYCGETNIFDQLGDNLFSLCVIAGNKDCATIFKASFVIPLTSQMFKPNCIEALDESRALKMLTNQFA